MRRMVNEKDIALMEDLNDNNISSKTISQLYIVDNIKTISNDILNKLKAGDIVLKNTNGQLHAYSVSFKKDDEGICLTYSDASVVETQSYDLVDGVWTYNSEDKTNLVNYTAGDNISINNGVISATDTKYTAGDNITIEDGVISTSGGNLYESVITFQIETGVTVGVRLITKEELTSSNYSSIFTEEARNKKLPTFMYSYSELNMPITNIITACSRGSGNTFTYEGYYIENGVFKSKQTQTITPALTLVYSHVLN